MTGFSLFKCDLDQAAIGALTPVLASGQLASGPHVAALEEEVAAYLCGGHVVAMGDMTHALSLALQLANVGAGDEVLTLSYNCLSSNSAISSVGARPVWVDLDPASAAISLEDAALAVTPHTKAVVVYHVAGYPADLTAVRRFCDERNLPLIEDANAAFGAEVDGSFVGTVGDFSVFSFYANRQVSAIEGAVLVCKDADAARKARQLRRFGIDTSRFRDANGEINPRTDIEVIGMSSPLTNVNAALARHGLAGLTKRLDQTRRNASLLDELLGSTEGLTPVRYPRNAKPSFWTWLVLSERRDELLVKLKAAGVQCSKLHQPNHIYSGFDAVVRPLPGTTNFMERILVLPCGWWLDSHAITNLANTVRSCLAQASCDDHSK